MFKGDLAPYLRLWFWRLRVPLRQIPEIIASCVLFPKQIELTEIEYENVKQLLDTQPDDLKTEELQ